MSAPKRLLVIGHDASRSGAPIALLTLVRWLGRSVPADVSLLLLRAGEFVGAYGEAVTTTVARSGPWSSMLNRVPMTLKPPVDLLGTGLGRARHGAAPDVILANSLASLEVGAHIAGRSRNGARLVCWVHELDGVSGRVLPNGRRRRQLLSRVDAFAAVSESVAQMLVDRMGVPENRVRTIPPAPGPARWLGEQEAAPEALEDLDPARPVVLSMGALGPRKGPERFVDLMTGISDHPSRPLGVWVGGSPAALGWDQMHADVARAASASCRLVASTGSPLSYLRRAALVVSTAVEDPFPLVLLEAAALGTPVAGYAAGGLQELLGAVGQDDALVPVGDALALIDVVGDLLDDPQELTARGRALAEVVATRHSIDEVGARMWRLISG